VAKIEDLVTQVSDERLRNELASEVRELKKLLATRSNEEIQGLFQTLKL